MKVEMSTTVQHSASTYNLHSASKEEKAGGAFKLRFDENEAEAGTSANMTADYIDGQINYTADWLQALEKFSANQESSAETGSEAPAQDPSDAEDADLESLLQALGGNIAEMKEKLKNGEIEKKIQIGNTAYTFKDWNKLIAKFDQAEDAVKKATAENSQNTVENKKEETAEDDKLSQMQKATETTGDTINRDTINIVDHLYEAYKGKKVK